MSTIGEQPFEFYLNKYKAYIDSVARSAYKNNKFLSIPDIEQELTIKAWDIYKKYSTAPQEDYIKILKTSICNKMATMATKVKKDTKFCSIFSNKNLDIDPSTLEAEPNFEGVYRNIETLAKELKGHKYITDEVKKKVEKFTEDLII